MHALPRTRASTPLYRACKLVVVIYHVYKSIANVSIGYIERDDGDEEKRGAARTTRKPVFIVRCDCEQANEQGRPGRLLRVSSTLYTLRFLPSFPSADDGDNFAALTRVRVRPSVREREARRRFLLRLAPRPRVFASAASSSSPS